jgi:hypothetical protein
MTKFRNKPQIKPKNSLHSIFIANHCNKLKAIYKQKAYSQD